MKKTKVSKEVMDTCMTYNDDILAGQQFFDFMFEDEIFVKAYSAVLEGNVDFASTDFYYDAETLHDVRG